MYSWRTFDNLYIIWVILYTVYHKRTLKVNEPKNKAFELWCFLIFFPFLFLFKVLFNKIQVLILLFCYFNFSYFNSSYFIVLKFLFLFRKRYWISLVEGHVTSLPNLGSQFLLFYFIVFIMSFIQVMPHVLHNMIG